jgi:hypothetical protein
MPGMTAEQFWYSVAFAACIFGDRDAMHAADVELRRIRQLREGRDRQLSLGFGSPVGADKPGRGKGEAHA